MMMCMIVLIEYVNESLSIGQASRDDTGATEDGTPLNQKGASLLFFLIQASLIMSVSLYLPMITVDPMLPTSFNLALLDSVLLSHC